MFIAHNDFGKRITIHNAKKGNSYYCPFCKCQLIVRKGEIRAPHFAHKSEAGGESRYCAFDGYSSMTDWHFTWQNLFPEENIEIIREKDGKRHIADILLNNVVIEFQHSNIAIEEFRERNEFFTSLGYIVIWVFDLVDSFKNGEIIQDPHYINQNQFNWAHPKKLFKQMNLEKEQCQIYFQFSDGEDTVLQRVAKSHHDFKVFITDKYHCYSSEEFVQQALTDPKGLFYIPTICKSKTLEKPVATETENKLVFSTLTDLWKENTKWMIALNTETGVAYNFRYSPQSSLAENNMVFAQRESGRKFVEGKQRYTFYSNDVPLIDWNKKIWKAIYMTTRQDNVYYTIREIEKQNPNVDKIKVKNTLISKEYLLIFVQEDPYISSRKVYFLLLDGNQKYYVPSDTDEYKRYYDEKVWTVEAS